MLPARVRRADFCKHLECFQRSNVIVLHKLCDPLLSSPPPQKGSSFGGLLSFGCKIIVRCPHVLKKWHMRVVKHCSCVCLNVLNLRDSTCKSAIPERLQMLLIAWIQSSIDFPSQLDVGTGISSCATLQFMWDTYMTREFTNHLFRYRPSGTTLLAILKEFENT